MNDEGVFVVLSIGSVVIARCHFDAVGEYEEKMIITSSIYRTRSYMKWRYGGVRHGAIGSNSWDIAFGVLALG